jgi:hypothetical protein
VVLRVADDAHDLKGTAANTEQDAFADGALAWPSALRERLVDNGHGGCASAIGCVEVAPRERLKA